MIDMFALLVSTGMMGLVVFFAIRLNRQREWFEKPQPSRPAKPGKQPARPVPAGATRRSPALPSGRGTPWRRDA